MRGGEINSFQFHALILSKAAESALALILDDSTNHAELSRLLGANAG